MAETVSVETLKLKLREVFCNENKSTKKYAEVWLLGVDFGGLYHSDKHVVNVKTEHEIDSCNDEIKYIFTHLNRNLAPEMYERIWRVDVYNANEQIHCQVSQDDILIYRLPEAC
jgi:hypothetical protein